MPPARTTSTSRTDGDRPAGLWEGDLAGPYLRAHGEYRWALDVAHTHSGFLYTAPLKTKSEALDSLLVGVVTSRTAGIAVDRIRLDLGGGFTPLRLEPALARLGVAVEWV